MTLDEAKRRDDYKFTLDGIEYLIEDVKEQWMKDMRKNGEEYTGVAILEIGYVCIEVNIATKEQVSIYTGDKTPVINYFVYTKNEIWEPDGDAEHAVKVNWNADDWREQLEKDMFIALDEYVEKYGYYYDRPNN